MKILHRMYFLANQTTNQHIVVYPPLHPGLEGDRVGMKNEKGEWIRRFLIVDDCGVQAFKGKSFVVLTHPPTQYPSIKIGNHTWKLEEIEGIRPFKRDSL